MSADLILYTNPMSRGRTARWMLEEVGEPYDVALLEFGAAMKTPDYLAINPMGKVPALAHGGTTVTEVAAICAYLADAFPAAGLAPERTSPDRAAYYRWLFFAAGPLEAAITDRALKVAIPREREGMVGYGSFDQVMNILEATLRDREFIASDRFSAADLYVGSHVAFGLRFGSIDSRPAFVDYARRLSARPAAVRAAAADDALLPA